MCTSTTMHESLTETYFLYTSVAAVPFRQIKRLSATPPRPEHRCLAEVLMHRSMNVPLQYSAVPVASAHENNKTAGGQEGGTGGGVQPQG